MLQLILTGVGIWFFIALLSDESGRKAIIPIAIVAAIGFFFSPIVALALVGLVMFMFGDG